MISKFLFTLESGWKQVRSNSKLLFIVVILFVFPLLIMLVMQQFNAVATANIQTAEFKRTDTLHSSVSAVLRASDMGTVNRLVQDLAADSADLTSLRVYVASDANVVEIVASSDLTELNATSTLSTVLQLGKVEFDQTFTVPLIIATGRIEQAVRYVETTEQSYYIFSEYSRAQTDTVLNQRTQDSYLLLTLFFSFLIGLAYWINRQSDWEKRHNKIKTTLDERDLFTTMIAHEFRTPLTAIKGYASFLQESTTMLPEEIRFADTIQESAERLVLLVNDFLEIARIQSGKLTIETKPVDVRSQIQTVTTSLAKEANTKGLQLIYTPNLQPQILVTDANRFVQILANIVSNSIKYTDKGTVEISSEMERAGLVIRIKDTGMGISAEDQKRLFAPFARVGGVDKTTTTGTGLGMWITKQMIELLHGTIAVESIKGVGTHIVLRFKQSER
jgi:signal transduction histidine kinase